MLLLLVFQIVINYQMKIQQIMILALENIYRLNRYSGNDKMDNSKRITYGLSAYTKILNHLYHNLMNLQIIVIFIKNKVMMII